MNIETRVCYYLSDLKDLAPEGSIQVEQYKYAKFIDDYLLMISQSQLVGPDYNVMITVMGHDLDRAKEVMQNYLDTIDVQTKPAPKHLQELYDRILEDFKF